MSKTVTIPMSPSPYVVTINNTRYEYKAGATVSVPDEVAALIAANAGNAPVEDDPTVRLVTEIGEDASDKQYPTAKAVKDAIDNIEHPCAEAVADATADTAVTTINAIIAALVGAGLMEEYEAPETTE